MSCQKVLRCVTTEISLTSYRPGMCTSVASVRSIAATMETYMKRLLLLKFELARAGLLLHRGERGETGEGRIKQTNQDFQTKTSERSFFSAPLLRRRDSKDGASSPSEPSAAASVAAFLPCATRAAMASCTRPSAYEQQTCASTPSGASTRHSRSRQPR